MVWSPFSGPERAEVELKLSRLWKIGLETEPILLVKLKKKKRGGEVFNNYIKKSCFGLLPFFPGQEVQERMGRGTKAD